MSRLYDRIIELIHKIDAGALPLSKKMGYYFINGEPQLNEDKEYIIIKNLK